jgi:hypothetical protein
VSSSRRSSKTCVRKRPENDSLENRSLAAGPLVVRKSTPADPATRWLEVSVMRHDVESGGAPQRVPQPFGIRFRGELDRAVRGMPRQSASPLRPRMDSDRHGARAKGRDHCRVWRKHSLGEVPFTPASHDSDQVVQRFLLICPP